MKSAIKSCNQRADHELEESWYFVIIFILFYSRGFIFGSNLKNRSFNDDLPGDLMNKLQRGFLPSHVEINGFKISLRLFELIQDYHHVYQQYMEVALLNRCKNFMITGKKLDNTQSLKIEDKKNAFNLPWNIKQLNFHSTSNNGKNYIYFDESDGFQIYQIVTTGDAQISFSNDEPSYPAKRITDAQDVELSFYNDQLLHCDSNARMGHCKSSAQIKLSLLLNISIYVVTRQPTRHKRENWKRKRMNLIWMMFSS